ncbi:metal-dependent hydrolase [Psychromonas sp. RZ22]|uniref:metal-dependent hydrolase n=1 Tax=Psychromonas algarum TaxID=2555643 RepID=UPI001067AF56|nr:metal-dependent hydrolase [Psychromonas sp. RZ22]TEW53886.1 metal-dependent hydrolase [Psychromonas sp. RZ22]
MDSLTQITLGASIAGAVAIKPFGRKVLLTGAILGTLPDLDVLLSYSTAIDNFTYHRGFSHSLFVLSALSILLYYFILWLKPQLSMHKKTLFLVIFLPLVTHPLLDAFTSYGTQLWWPIAVQPTSWSSIFIIDPLYTLPLLIAVIALWCHQTSKKWQKVNRLMLLISCLYLAIGQAQVMYLKGKVAQDTLAKNSQVFLSPTPFNTFIWRIISYQDDLYYETFTNVLDQQPLKWKKLTTGRTLLNDFDSKELQRLEWFSGGLLSFEEKNKHLIATDLRIGLSSYYPFSFSIAKQENHWIAIPSKKAPQTEVKLETILESIRL